MHGLLLFPAKTDSQGAFSRWLSTRRRGGGTMSIRVGEKGTKKVFIQQLIGGEQSRADQAADGTVTPNHVDLMEESPCIYSEF